MKSDLKTRVLGCFLKMERDRYIETIFLRRTNKNMEIGVWGVGRKKHRIFKEVWSLKA